MRIIWFPADGNTYPWEDIASLTQNYVSQAKPLLGADVQADDGKMALLLTLPSARLDLGREDRRPMLPSFKTNASVEFSTFQCILKSVEFF